MISYDNAKLEIELYTQSLKDLDITEKILLSEYSIASLWKTYESDKLRLLEINQTYYAENIIQEAKEEEIRAIEQMNKWKNALNDLQNKRIDIINKINNIHNQCWILD